MIHASSCNISLLYPPQSPQAEFTMPSNLVSWSPQTEYFIDKQVCVSKNPLEIKHFALNFLLGTMLNTSQLIFSTVGWSRFTIIHTLLKRKPKCRILWYTENSWYLIPWCLALLNACRPPEMDWLEPQGNEETTSTHRHINRRPELTGLGPLTENHRIWESQHFIIYSWTERQGYCIWLNQGDTVS